jgi:hypothetical protein
MSEHNLFNGYLALQREKPGLYGQLLGGQLDYLANQGQHHVRDFCAAFLAYLVSMDQYQTAQDFVRTFLLPRAITNSAIVWQVYKAFRADADTPEHMRKGLPWDIGYALSNCDISLADVMQLYELPGWTNRFDWVILAQRHRGALQRMLRDAPYRLPDHFWTVIKSTWLLVDMDPSQQGIATLRDRVADGYGFAKNAIAAGLAMAALRNFQSPEDMNDPEAYEFLESLRVPRAASAAALAPPAPLTEACCACLSCLAVEPVVLPPTVWEQAPGAKRGRRRGGRRHRKAKAAASGGAAAGAGGGR